MFLDFIMDVSSDSRLEHKDIKNILSRLTSRQLYILIHEMYLNDISINISNNLDYLTNQLHLLGYRALVLHGYVDRCMNRVIGDEYVKWLKDNLRAAIWFDVYLSNSRASLSIDRFSLHSDFKHDFLKSFDACHFLGKSDFADTHFNTRSNSFLIPNQSSTPFSLKMNPDYEFETASLHMMQIFHSPNSISNSSNPHLKRPTRFPPRAPSRTDIIKNTKNQAKLKTKFVTSARMKYVLDMASVKDLKWLDNKDERQIDWATAYLESKNLLWKPYLFIASGGQDKYDQICASIDSFELQKHQPRRNNKILDLSQKDFIEKMRNAWYQIKSKEKAPRKLPEKPLLGSAYQKKLKKLCDNYGVDSSTYLKGLIDDELKKL